MYTNISEVTGQPSRDAAKPVSIIPPAKKPASLEATQKESPQNEAGIATPSEMKNLEHNID